MDPLLLKLLEHIKKNAHCSEKHIMILLDKHKCHCMLDVVPYCTENGIAMCIFPPH